MPVTNNHTPIQLAWIGYTDAVKLLLAPQVNDRPLDQYLAFRDAVFIIVQNKEFLDKLNEAWQSQDLETSFKDALLLELQAFPRAIEVSKTMENMASPSSGWSSKWASRASTVGGSVSDILNNLPPYAKNAITLFKELLDLFKGKE